jgi:hypothetical protein
MITRPRGALAVAATAAALALTGCGADTAPATPAIPTGAASPAVEPQEQTLAWTDSVCGALVPVAESLMNPPGLDPTALDATREAYVTYLARAQGAADKAVQDVAAAGPAPVDDGQQVAEEVRDQLTDLRDDLGDARTQLEQADANDATTIGQAVVAAGNVVGAVGNNAQALSALDGNPRLDAAFEQAQSCQRLRTVQTPGNPGR